MTLRVLDSAELRKARGGTQWLWNMVGQGVMFGLGNNFLFSYLKKYQPAKETIMLKKINFDRKSKYHAMCLQI